MQLYSRRRLGKKEFPVYDSPEEAREHGITNIKPCTERGLKEGDWIEYVDGRVAQVLKISPNVQSNFIQTVLNRFAEGGRRVKSTYTIRYFPSTEETLHKVSDSKLRFVEEWLFHGYTIEQSAKRNLKAYFSHYVWETRYSVGQLDKYAKGTGMVWRLLGYFILNGKWFDDLMKRSRPIRDRYITMLSELKRAGVTEGRIADKIAEFIEDPDHKKSIPALRMALDIYKVESELNKGKGDGSSPIDTSEIIRDNGERKALPEKRMRLLDEALDTIEDEQRELQEMESGSKENEMEQKLKRLVSGINT